MTATIIHLPLPTPNPEPDATIGALATHNGHLYTRGAPGWICIAGSPHGPTYHQWLETLPTDAITIREGL